MPSSILSHQAPGLLLKIKYPKKFDGTALCLSTFVVDLSVLVEIFVPFNFRNISHSILGLFIWTIPLTLVFTIFFSKLLAPGISFIAKKNFILFKPLKYFGLDSWDKLRFKKFNRKFLLTASYSALIGGITHLLLDLPSHQYVELFYPLNILESPEFLLTEVANYTLTIRGSIVNVSIAVYEVLWMIESLITLIISLYFLRYIKINNLLVKWYGFSGEDQQV
jgi:membrane-bound metal-dependent hydrolase YbcI (DUF457 family)